MASSKFSIKGEINNYYQLLHFRTRLYIWLPGSKGKGTKYQRLLCYDIQHIRDISCNDAFTDNTVIFYISFLRKKILFFFSYFFKVIKFYLITYFNLKISFIADIKICFYYFHEFIRIFEVTTLLQMNSVK